MASRTRTSPQPVWVTIWSKSVKAVLSENVPKVIRASAVNAEKLGMAELGTSSGDALETARAPPWSARSQSGVDVIVPTPARAAVGSASDRSASFRSVRDMVVPRCAHIIPKFLHDE